MNGMCMRESSSFLGPGRGNVGLVNMCVDLDTKKDM